MQIDEINRKLNDKKRLLTDVYFELQEFFQEKYGENVLIFLELGSFFEIYEVSNEKIKLGKAKEVAGLLNIQLTRKNKSILENSINNPLMAGVPSVAFERHLNRLIQEGKYTIALIRQKGEPPKVTRYLSQIISPGTNFDFLADSGENFIVSLSIDVHKNSYLIGYSAMDVSTGVSYISELYSTEEDANYALDEVFNLLNKYKTSEIVLNFINRNVNQHKVLEYLEIKKNYHFTVQHRRFKIEFQNELFKRVFNTKSFLSPIEELNLEHFPLASESLAILIEFIFQHDYKIVEKINRPTILKNRNYLYLGNNAIEQLDIISKSDYSVLNLIDKTSTPMGKRLLKSRLLNPIFNPEIINSRYDLVEKTKEFIAHIDNKLKKIYDLERILRRIKLRKLNPMEINYLHTSIQATIDIVKIVKRNLIYDVNFTNTELQEIADRIENCFDLNISGKYSLNGIAENIFLRGVNLEIDKIEEQIKNNLNKLNKIVEKIETMLSTRFDKNNKNLVTLGLLEKDGYYISLTRNRFKLIEAEFLNEKIILDGQEYLFANFKVRKLSNNVKITADIIDKISEQINSLKVKLMSLVKDVFLQELTDFEIKHSLTIERVIEFISNIDVAVSTGKVAKAYKYVKPTIVKVEKDENFLQIRNLRHPLIEQREVNGIYVPNDVFLGEKKYLDKSDFDKTLIEATEENKIDGILLYGINSSGKSSLMKSVGIAIILAQAGFYVPAENMRFAVFESLFTRIISKDNLEKGLSSFAVEMVELKNIFNRSGKRSIVLGDEISHGTETLSGVSIVASAIIRLVEKGSLFIFATHLHQLNKIDEVQKLSSVINLHLAVKYDEKNDKLIFNRKLQLGSGSSIYGLEFAKSLHIDKRFLNLANSIRKKVSEEYSELDLILQQKKSRYNSKLYLTKCIICGEKIDDVHQIVEKKKAVKGFIGHFSKNHKYNLLPLCKTHHKEIHSGKIEVQGFLTTSQGLELHYEIKEEEKEN